MKTKNRTTQFGQALLFALIIGALTSGIVYAYRTKHLNEPYLEEGRRWSCGTMASYWALKHLGFALDSSQWETKIDIAEHDLGHWNHDNGHCMDAIKRAIIVYTNYNCETHWTSWYKHASYYCIDEGHCTVTPITLPQGGHVFTSHGYFDNPQSGEFWYCSHETWIPCTHDYTSCTYPGWGYYLEVSRP